MVERRCFLSHPGCIQENMTMYQISILKEETDAWLIDNCLEYIEFIFSIKISLIFSTFLRALELYYPGNDPNFSKKIFFGCYCKIIIVRGGPVFVGFVGSHGSIYKHLFNTYSFTKKNYQIPTKLRPDEQGKFWLPTNDDPNE